MCYFVVSADTMDPKILGSIEASYFGAAVNDLMDRIEHGEYPYNVVLIESWEMSECARPSTQISRSIGQI